MGTVRIKRGFGIPDSETLKDGELGFNKSNNKLYVGSEEKIHELFGPGAKIMPYRDYEALLDEEIDENTIYFCTDDFDEILTKDTAFILLGITATPTELNYTDGVTSNIQTQFNDMWKKIYPIGSVYISYESTPPASLFGGKWTELKGVFPYFNSGTSTGGSNTHTLTLSEIPSHTHTFTGTAVTSGTQSANHTHSQVAHTHTVGNNSASHTHSISSSGGHSHTSTIQLTEGALASGTKFSRVSSTGGATTGLITTNSTGAHTHTTGGQSANHTHVVNGGATTTGSNSASHTHSITAKGTNSSSGGGGSHNNMPAYQTLYAWRRVE